MSDRPSVPGVEVVVDSDAARAGAAVRRKADAGERVAGFVGDPDDPALSELVADVLAPRADWGGAAPE